MEDGLLKMSWVYWNILVFYWIIYFDVTMILTFNNDLRQIRSSVNALVVFTFHPTPQNSGRAASSAVKRHLVAIHSIVVLYFSEMHGSHRTATLHTYDDLGGYDALL